MQRVLWLGWGGVIVLEEEVLDVPVHGRPACPFGIVPGKIDAGIFLACPVCGVVVMCEQSLEKMIRVVFVGVLNAEVVEDQDEDERSPVVSPEAGHNCTLVGSMFGETGGQQVIGKFAGFLEAVDTFIHFEVDPFTVGISRDVVFINKFLRDVGEFDLDVFWAVKWQANVETFYVNAD